MDQVTVPGSVSADQEICNGNSPEDISLTGTVGKVLNWQSSSNVNFTSLNDIDGTSTTLAGTAIGGLTNTTYFRAVVQSGVCDIKYSDPVKVSINSLPTPTISGPASACLNVLGSTYSTQAGMSNYVWSVTGGTITAGGKSTDVTLTVTWTSTGAKSISVNYADGNTCTAASPFTYNVTVNSLPTPTISGPASACLNVPGSTYSTQAGMSNYVWSVTGGTITAGGQSTDATTTVTWTSTGAKSISVNYADGKDSRSDTISIH